MKKTKPREFHKTTGIREFKPADKAKATGIYEVFHDKIDGDHHAHPQQVIVLAGTVFPQCRGCHEWVRFRLTQEVESIDKDHHFAH
jgi:hypothetical protein